MHIKVQSILEEHAREHIFLLINCWVDLNAGVRWETESPAPLPLAP
jgi:hypothetical protein